MTEHEDYTIHSDELLTVSQTEGLILDLSIHAKHISTPYYVDGGFDSAGVDTETEVEIEVTAAYDYDGDVVEYNESEILTRSWWPTLTEKVEAWVEGQ